MAVMLLDHSRAGVAEVLRNHQQRHAVHNAVARPGVAQAVEIDRGADPCVFAGRSHAEFLMAFPPRHAIVGEHERATGLPGAALAEQGNTFVIEHHMPCLAGLALPDCDRTAVRAEIRDLKPGEFTVPAAGGECGLDQPPEIIIGATRRLHCATSRYRTLAESTPLNGITRLQAASDGVRPSRHARFKAALRLVSMRLAVDRRRR